MLSAQLFDCRTISYIKPIASSTWIRFSCSKRVRAFLFSVTLVTNINKKKQLQNLERKKGKELRILYGRADTHKAARGSPDGF